MEPEEKRACPWKEKWLRTPYGEGFNPHKNWFEANWLRRFNSLWGICIINSSAFPRLKPGVRSGLILSGSLISALKGGVRRRRSINEQWVGKKGGGANIDYLYLDGIKCIT
jgi:hypothetical protein